MTDCFDGGDWGDFLRIGNHAAVAGEGTAVAAARTAFTNSGGTVADPDGVELLIRFPDGTVESYGYGTTAGASGTLVNPAVGRYYYDRAGTPSGLWRCRLAGTGAVEAAVEWYVYVRPRVTWGTA